MQNETHRCNSTGYSSIHGSSDEKDYVEGVGVVGVWLPWTCIMMVWWGAPRTDVIQTPNHIDPALDLNLWCTQWKVNHGGTLSHTVGLLTAFHSQKEDELEPETNILRDRLPSTTAWAVGTKELKYCTARKNIFCTEPARAAQPEQKSLVPARQAQGINQGKDPFQLYSLSPHSPQFQQSA